MKQQGHGCLHSELSDIHHKATFVKPKPQSFLTGGNGWPARIKRIYCGIKKNENINLYLLNTSNKIHQIEVF